MHYEFEMINLDEMSNFFSMEVHKIQQGILINQENYVKEVLKKFSMENCIVENTPLT